jgi:Raf kinase inhibitor-like YbhB/YbcL family protein
VTKHCDPLRIVSSRAAKCLLAAVLSFIAPSVNASAFELTSPDFNPDQIVSEKFTFNGLGCKGQNVSPALRWKDSPAGTKSFALMVHDPDAVTGGAGIWAWVVVNIPATTYSIDQGAGTADGVRLPAGSRQISNDYLGLTNSPGYGGPCPPKGAKPHHYNFTIYALKIDKLDLPPNATSSLAGFLININALSKAKLTMIYGR